MKWILTSGVAGALTIAMALAWSSSRHRGQVWHCRNNLLWLGELAKDALREAKLNPDRPELDQLVQARGREFWQAVWRVKLWKKRRELSPFACPFVRPQVELSDKPDLPLEAIDYRGPSTDPYQASEFTPLGCDRPDSHGGGEMNVVYIKVRLTTRRGRGEEEQDIEAEIKVESVRRGDPRWDEALRLTRE
jgi:hypothetical protein